MSLQEAYLSIRFRTLCAFEGLFIRMVLHHVSIEISLQLELTGTLGTLVWLLASVGQQVLIQPALIDECHLTELARIHYS